MEIKASYFIEIKRSDNKAFVEELPENYMSYILDYGPERLGLEVVWWGRGYQAPHNVAGIIQFLEKYEWHMPL